MKQIFAVFISLVLFLAVAAAVVENKTKPPFEIKKERGSLYELVEKAAKNQFARDSDLYRAPNPAQQKTWQKIIENILGNRLEEAARDIESRSYPYDLSLFTDRTTDREYVLLREKTPQQAGWGLFVFNPNGKNQLIVEAPHTIADARTELEGIDAFLQTGARAFLMAGAHRRANKKETPCTQPASANNSDSDSTDYPESDVAHNTATMFQTVHETLVTNDPNLITVQFHGMIERDVCPNVFMSSGTRTVTTNSKKLFECLTAKQVEAGIYEGKKDGCPLGASTNVQGRFSNGEKTDPCGKSVKAAPEPGYFIHIEQEPSVRRNRESWQPVIAALKCAFP